MADNSLGAGVVILLTLLIAMVLMVVPIPASVPTELGFLRPDWVAMVLVYWVIALPQRVGLLTAWIVGILTDVLLGNLLGQHALAYVLITYIASNLYQRLRMFSVWQQALVLFVILGINHLVGFWVESFAGLSDWRMWYLLPALSGAFLWPWVFLLLRFTRRKFYLS